MNNLVLKNINWTRKPNDKERKTRWFGRANKFKEVNFDNSISCWRRM